MQPSLPIIAEPIFVFTNLPLVLKFLGRTQSSAAQLLENRGVRNIAEDMASRNLPLAGRINHFLSSWQAITQDEWVLSAVRGHRIEFLRLPYQRSKPPQLHLTEKECMQAEIQSMTNMQYQKQRKALRASFPNVSGAQKGRQAETCDKPEEAKPVSEDRALQDGRHSHAERPAKSRRLDGKDRPERCLLHETHCSGGLKFKWKDQMYQFNCLPFGLSSAPWVFTKNTWPVVAAQQEIGLRLIIYIDDIIVMVVTESLLKDHVAVVVYLLENLGFVINHPKSELDPSQEIEFLGFTVNSKTMELKVPGEKIKKIRAEAGKVLQPDTESALTLSQLIGKMDAAKQAIPMAPLYYRNV